MKSGPFSQLISIVLLFLIALGSLIFIFPLRGEISTLKVARDSVSAQLQILESDYEALAALSEQVATSEVTKQSLMAALPKGYAQDELLLELSGIAEELKFNLNALNFTESVDEFYGKNITMNANFTGSYEQLIAFLQRVETADRLMRTVSLNVQRTTSTEVAFNVSIEAYSQ